MQNRKVCLLVLFGFITLFLQGCLFSDDVGDYRAGVTRVERPGAADDFLFSVSTQLIKKPDEILRGTYEKYEQGVVRYTAKVCSEVDLRCQPVPPLAETCFCGDQNDKDIEGSECLVGNRDLYSLTCYMPLIYNQNNAGFHLLVYRVDVENHGLVFIDRSPLLSAEILREEVPARVEEQAGEDARQDAQPQAENDGGAQPEEEAPAGDVKDPLPDLAKAIQELEESKVGKNSGGCFSLANGNTAPTLDWLVVGMLIGVFGIWRLSPKWSGKFFPLFFVIISTLILNGCLSDKVNDYQVTRQGQIVTKLNTENLTDVNIQGVIPNAKKEVCLYNIDGENGERCVNVCDIEKVNADWKLFCNSGHDDYPVDRRLQPNQLFRLKLSYAGDPRKAYSPYLTLNWLNNANCEGGRGDRIAEEFSEFRWNNGHLVIKGRFRLCSPQQWQAGSRIGEMVYRFITPEGINIDNRDHIYSCQTEYVSQRDGYFSCRFFPSHRGFMSVRLQMDIRYEGVADPVRNVSAEENSGTIQLTSSAIDLTRYVSREFLVEAESGEAGLPQEEGGDVLPAADDADAGAGPGEEAPVGDIKDPFPDLTKLLQGLENSKSNKKGGGCFSLANGNTTPTLDWLVVGLLVGVFGVLRLSTKLRDKTFRA